MNSRIALGAVLLAAGILWLLAAADVVDLSYQTSIGVLLVLIGLAIALTPGRHGLLVLVGILVLLAGLPALVVDEEVFEGGVGDAVETPATTADLEPYRHGVGKLTIDVTSPGLRRDEVAVDAKLGIGELLVIVPRNADVSVDAHVGIGNVDALGETESGTDVDLQTSIPGPGDQQVSLDLEVGIGDVRVERG